LFGVHPRKPQQNPILLGFLNPRFGLCVARVILHQQSFLLFTNVPQSSRLSWVVFSCSHSPSLVASPVLQLVSELVKDFPFLIGSKSTKATWNVVLASHHSLMGQTTHTEDLHVCISLEYWVSSLGDLPRCCLRCCECLDHSNLDGIS
jgi:hypothetical protein